MKKITIIIITLAMIIVIVAPFLIVLLPEIKTSVKDIVLNWSDVGEILDKFVQIMSAALIPILIFYFGRQDANRKDLEIENLKLKKEEKYHEEAKELTAGIQKAFKETYKKIKIKNYILSNFDSMSRTGTEIFQHHISNKFGGEEKRILIYKILTEMQIFYERDNQYSFHLISLAENPRVEWSIGVAFNEIYFCNVLNKLAEEFDSDLHLKRVIEILKDLDE